MSFDARHDRLSKIANHRRASGGNGVLHWLGGDRVQQIHAALVNAGVELNGPGGGRMVIGDVFADVWLEPDEVLHVTCAAPLTLEPQALLERCAGAPGSVRFTQSPIGRRLAADTRINGVAHLSHSLRGVSAGLSQALNGGAHSEPSDDSSVELLRTAIHEAGWAKEDLVETPHGYELDTLLEGIRTTVHVIAHSQSALVQRTVLARLPDGMTGNAVSHQALSCNARLRCCRLAVSAGRLMVESRLEMHEINGDWLSFTVRAVAGVARGVEPLLHLLAHEPAVAEAYVEMFRVGQAASLP
jgi:hypothetical protein